MSLSNVYGFVQWDQVMKKISSIITLVALIKLLKLLKKFYLQS